jgi:hypothetical protein
MDAQRGVRLAGAARWRFVDGAGDEGAEARRLPHHQKIPMPSNARRITPTMVTRVTQRTASLAIRKKIASMMVPAMMKIVVELISSLSVVRVSCQFLVFGLWFLVFGL